MEIHINLGIIGSIEELQNAINELKKMEDFSTKIFVNVERLEIGLPAGTDKPTDVINHSCQCQQQEC